VNPLQVDVHQVVFPDEDVFEAFVVDDLIVTVDTAGGDGLGKCVIQT